MKGADRLFRQENLLPVVLGFSDGILTALTLAAGRLTNPEHGVSFGLGLRISAGAFASGAFVFFVARYAELRGELIRAERQLNLTAHGRLAASRLGDAVLREATLSGLISSVAAFCGALVPLAAAALVPGYRWTSIGTALAALALLGVALAHVVHGSVVRWSVGLAAGGAALTIAGMHLKLIG
jgi:predicted membrane protein (TIGR00267 family)